MYVAFLYLEVGEKRLAAKKNPKVDEAYKLYKDGMKLVDIANQLGVPDGTVRRWKSTYKWDSERSDYNQNERSESISWIEIEHEYVTDIRKKPCTLESLSSKYSIAVGTIEKYSMEHNWSEKRKKYKENIKQKAIEKSSDADADRIIRLLQLADTAADKAEQSLNELESYVVKNKHKTKEVVLHDVFGKPVKETIDEREEIETMQGPIDRQGLLFITNALKNLKDIQLTPMGVNNMEHKQELERQKMELELLKLEMQTKADGESEETAEDNFLEALNAAAKDVWSGE